MKNVFFLLLLIASFGGCSSNKAIVQGFSGKELEDAVKRIRGLTVKEALNSLGEPAIHGKCKTCGPKRIYRVIYLQKDMRRFYLDISYNTGMEVDCVILDFLPNPKIKKYTFVKFAMAKNCNQRDGEIIKFQQILDAPQ